MLRILFLLLAKRTRNMNRLELTIRSVQLRLLSDKVCVWSNYCDMRLSGIAKHHCIISLFVCIDSCHLFDLTADNDVKGRSVFN